MEIVIWFCFAVGCTLVAKKKNRSAVGWFLWGVVGGIFALGILLLLPTLNATEVGGGTKTSENIITSTTNQLYKKCPYCAEQILAEAIVCKHCGRDLNQSLNQ